MEKQGQLFELIWVCNCIIVPSGRNQVMLQSLWCQCWVTPLSLKQDRGVEMVRVLLDRPKEKKITI